MATGDKPELGNPWTDALEHDTAVVYMVDAGLCLRYCNLAWNDFAGKNGGGPELQRTRVIGRCLNEVIPAPLRQFYQSFFESALKVDHGVDHFYECSSADEERWFHMHVARVDPGHGEPLLIVINSLAVYEPMDRAAVPWEAKKFESEAGFITMCAHCRRTLAIGPENHWVWVPKLVREMPLNVSHGLCRICYQLYYSSFTAISTS